MALSDKALSILTFAAYHRLASGESVREVVLEDGHGHKADPDGLDEAVGAGLVEIDGRFGRLTDAGLARLDAMLEAIRGAA